MEFGKVDPTALDQVDFRLPAEPRINKNILPGKRNPKAALYIGCAKWNRPEWIGKIYPPKTREKDFLARYVEQYNSIELNATHYKLYGPAGISKWSRVAGEMDFKFCPKMYQAVTHR
jgi:hypothetical protein